VFIVCGLVTVTFGVSSLFVVIKCYSYNKIEGVTINCSSVWWTSCKLTHLDRPASKVTNTFDNIVLCMWKIEGQSGRCLMPDLKGLGKLEGPNWDERMVWFRISGPWAQRIRMWLWREKTSWSFWRRPGSTQDCWAAGTAGDGDDNIYATPMYNKKVTYVFYLVLMCSYKYMILVGHCTGKWLILYAALKEFRWRYVKDKYWDMWV
jgi:hypothetical protein